MARILTGIHYNDVFNTPRLDTLDVFVRKRVRNLRRLWGPLLAVSIPHGGCDLIHSFNCIPLGLKPYIISFEGELPRTLGEPWPDLARHILQRFLLSKRCRGLFPVSNFARRLFTRHCADWPQLDVALAKCTVIYPNVPLRRNDPKQMRKDELVLTFVGSEWARKGGAVCSRLLRLLRRERVRFRLNVISNLWCGPPIHTDTVAEFYQGDLRELDCDEVHVHRNMPNAEVVRIVEDSDLCLLPTLDDSFGYSVLESLSCGTPVIASGVCAIPEILDRGVDGFLLDLPVDDMGRWQSIYTTPAERAASAYRDLLDATFDNLAQQCAAAIIGILDRTHAYETLSDNAIRKVAGRFEMNRRAAEWHSIYAASLDRS